MKRTAFLFCLLVSAIGLYSQQIAPLHGWTAYTSFLGSKSCAMQGEILWMATEGGIFSYKTSTHETETYTTIEGLSGISPTTIYYAENLGILLVGFKDGRVNFFSDPEEIEYVTDIARTETFTTKEIRQFLEYEDLIYIATDFGVVVYDIGRKETRQSYTKIGTNDTGIPINSIAMKDDTLWVSTGVKGLWYADINQPNLSDPSAWTQESGANGLPTGKVDEVTVTGDLVYTVVVDEIYVRKGKTWVFSGLPRETYTDISSSGNNFLAIYNSITIVIKPDSTVEYINNDGSPACACRYNDITYVGDVIAGAMRYENGYFVKISPDGPVNNFAEQIDGGNGEIYIAPKGHGGTAPIFNQSGFYYFNLEDGWKNLWARNNELSTNSVWLDFARVYYDDNTETAYLGSWGQGLMEVKHGDTVRTYTSKNSGLTKLGTDDQRVSGIAVDNDGNLWVSLVFANGDSVLNVKTQDGQWYAYRLPSTNPLDFIIDDYGTKWIRNLSNGLVVFNENGTLDDRSDDDTRFLTTAIGGGGLPSNDVRSLSKDLDGQIWIGTPEGVTVFYDPGSIFSTSSSDASCPVFNSRCLLKDVTTNAIAIDGANRKWLGTDDGVYLMSEDGSEQILHFTTENSPLFDNRVVSMHIDQSTGEVFFGTDKGVISFMGDATEPKETSEEVFIFPNPVYSDFTGGISIRGTVAEATVKITTVDGQLVKELESLGGQAVWDGTDVAGKRIKTGVYLVLISDKNGKNAGFGKIAFINR